MTHRTLVAVLTLILGCSLNAAAQSSKGKPRIMQGPMIGYTTPDSIGIWCRVNGPWEVQIQWSSTPDFAQSNLSSAQTADKQQDYILKFMIGGLEPNKDYYYKVLVDGHVDPYLEAYMPFRTHTSPAPEWTGRFSVGFGSCARYQADQEQRIWLQVERAQPDLFFWTGDNIYGDAIDPDILAEEYRRQRDVAGFGPVQRSIPQLATWDDHDFGLNNHDRNHPGKADALSVFREYWYNPSYGLPGTPGVFFAYSYGPVDFFFLDDRYYRDPNKEQDHPGKTMLGSEQLAWLQDGLKESSAVFKVLVSGSGWTKAKGAGGDSWASYINERDALFSFIRDSNIEGVILLSGDTHVAELNAVPWSQNGGYDMYDLTSSPLAQSTERGSWLERRPELRIRPVYFNSTNFGMLEFDLDRPDPQLTYNVINEDGVPVWKPFILRASELRNGVSSWESKIDRTEKQRMENHHAGKGYYERIGGE